MSSPIWLDADFIRAVHERILAEFGGTDGIRDAGRIDAALDRPKQAFGYGVTDIYALAASYACAIIQGHPFLDGNKRTGLVVAVVFLELNGKCFLASEAETVLQTLALAASELTEQEFAQWLKRSCKDAD